MSDHARVAGTLGALYSPARRCRKRRRCDGHLTDRHWIEVGDPIHWSALPPDSEIGNRGWWHAAYCQDCAPIGSHQAEGRNAVLSH